MPPLTPPLCPSRTTNGSRARSVGAIPERSLSQRSIVRPVALNLAAVVMAGGLGTRMRSATPKHFHVLLGRRMVDWVVEAARALEADPLVVVTSPDGKDAFDGVRVAVQEKPRGTGDALAAARDSLDGLDGEL